MDTEQSLALNLFPIEPKRFAFDVYRKSWTQNDAASEGCYKHSLLIDRSASVLQKAAYWITFSPRTGFEPFSCCSHDNPGVTKRYLFWLLHESCLAKLQPTQFSLEDSFRQRITFVLKSFRQGDQCVWISPYYLGTQQLFGFLADFRFRRKAGVPFGRDILQLSLSLDRQFRDNCNFYTDRYQQLQDFTRQYQRLIFPLQKPPATSLDIRINLSPVASNVLDPKRYVFQNDATSNSQFVGVKEHGPLAIAPETSRVCFMYRPDEKAYSHDLFRALRGDTFTTFGGMSKIFRFPLSKEHVIGMPVTGFGKQELETAILELKQQSNNRVVVPVLLVPWSRHDVDHDPDPDYYGAKHAFLRHCLPSQFISLKTIQNKQSFKWSVSNIALAIFAKMGGQPWKVMPSHQDCLIVGIGQAHKWNDQGEISRYYAYSVLTDSSGLYEDLRVLGRDTDQNTYLTHLKSSLQSVFTEHAGRFRRFAIHTTFSLRQKEMAAIHEAIAGYKQAAKDGCEFVVLKFNDDSQFFGYNQRANSMVPRESSIVSLGRGEYMVWFEGLQYDRASVGGRTAKPINIRFMYPTDPPLSPEEQRAYLQDALNLSGANWRGFNAKTLPVSVYYAQLIARYFSEFDKLGLPEVNLESLTPWFL